MASDHTSPRGRPFPRKGATAAAGVVVLGVAVALGPRHTFETSWTEPEIGPDVDGYLTHREAGVSALRAGEAKSVLWVDPAERAATDLSLVYLHGFSADRHEVEPLVSDLGRALQANVYFARLRGHGRDGSALAAVTVEDWLADAGEALAIGSRIGEHVVLIGTSTGGTLALWTAAREETIGRLAALVLISPNLGLRDRMAPALLWPWGGVLARLVVGRERCFEPNSAEQALHWTTCYPSKALLPMMGLTEHVRGMDLHPVRVPTLLVYAPDDQVVDAGESERILSELGSGPPDVHVVRGSGDPESHVIAGDIMSPRTTGPIRDAILRFVSEHVP